MTKRQEFSKRTKLEMWERSGGRCECGCGLKIIGTPIYDHYPVAASLGGPATPDNGRVLDPKCNRRITYGQDIPQLAKSTRTFEKRLGLRPSRRPMAKRPKDQQWGRYHDAT